MEQEQQEQSTGFLEEVSSLFNPGFIFEAMLSRRAMRTGTKISELRNRISHNDILDEWKSFVRDQAVSMTNYIRDSREREIRAEVDQFIKEITPSTVFEPQARPVI